jgi:diguanylate cyclase (GGDEF)-like protein
MGRNRLRDADGDGTRQAAWLFVAAGLIGFVGDVVGGMFGHWMVFAVALDAVNITIGVSSRFVPWTRWHPRAVLVLPTLALVNLSINIASGFLPVSTEAVWVVLVFVWIGQWQPPRSAIAMGPVAAIAYSLPFAVGTPATDSAVVAVATSVPLAILVGETIARKEKATRLAQVGQREALALLAAANLTDDLTGLGNRRRANVLIDSLEPGDALAILDLDHFKRVNDSLGHQRGDEVLQDLGAYLRGAVRGADSVARFGGEEFVVVLREASSSASATILRLLAGWRATGPLTTLSAGLAVHRSGQSYDVTFAGADAALYEAKAAGRDRLVVDRQEPHLALGSGLQ